jgi:hypothetical protein
MSGIARCMARLRAIVSRAFKASVGINLRLHNP